MWGRRQTSITTPVAATAAPVAGALPPSAMDALLRRAVWEDLSETERSGLLQPFAGKPVSAATASGTPDGSADLQLQDWVARLVGAGFQPDAADTIRDWLEIAPPDGHLYIGGSAGQGRTSLVATLARAAMRARPTPPDYCYVPKPDALDQPQVLAVPRGTGAPFMQALTSALAQICQGWPATGGDDSENGEAAAPDRPRLVAAVLSTAEQSTPSEAKPYIASLRQAFTAMIEKGDTPPFCSDDGLAAGHVTPIVDAAFDEDGNALASGAPVVVATLAQTALKDALLRANGGVLVLQATDLGDSAALTTLFSVLRTGMLSLKAGWPAVPLRVRVALVGNGDTYQALDSASDDFGRIFRYEAWCDYDLRWTPQSEAAYAALAQGVATRHALPPFAASGVARLIEEGARRSGGLNRSRLNANLLVLHDLAVEAGRHSGAATATGGDDVEAAVQRRRAVHRSSANRVLDAILSGEEITPTAGAAVGQINGLGIYETHPVEGSFAVPIRISATASPGRDEKLVDIEAAVSAADASHVRGALTAEGYLNFRYAQERPISATVRIRFEQEHGATGGDSASAAIVFALLSALAQVPIRASVAVTGAVGQYGEMQPIGGVNTKIEGFWELCRTRRAQGEQPTPGGYGVIIPMLNGRDLMLRSEVARSIAEEGWFHVWPVATVEDGLAILTGVAAPAIHARVDERLKRFYELTRRTRG
ncbi:MAG: AAA family ATPase [Ktedonobacterales bacterium]